MCASGWFSRFVMIGDLEKRGQSQQSSHLRFLILGLGYISIVFIGAMFEIPIGRRANEQLQTTIDLTAYAQPL